MKTFLALQPRTFRSVSVVFVECWLLFMVTAILFNIMRAIIQTYKAPYIRIQIISITEMKLMKSTEATRGLMPHANALAQI